MTAINTLSRFVFFARGVASRAPCYKTKQACNVMLTRVKQAYVTSGSYGCVWHERAVAIAAIQDRWIELDCDERVAVLAARGKL